MNIRRSLSALLICAMLAVSLGVPAWADEVQEIAVEAQAPAMEAAPEPVPEEKHEEAAPQPEPEPEPEPQPQPEPEPAPEQPKAEAPQPEEKKEETQVVASQPEPEKTETNQQGTTEASAQPEPSQVEAEAPKEAPAQAETPKETPAQAEPPQQAPAAEAPAAEPEPVHSDTPAETVEQPADPAPASDPATDVTADPGAVQPENPEAPAQPEAPAATDAAQTEAPAPANPEKTEAPAPEPVKISGLSASGSSVLMGETASFSFSVRNAVSLSYRLTDPSGSVDSGALSPDADRYGFTPSKEGKYTFELTATGASGDTDRDSASLTSINAPALNLSVKANEPSCHGGDPVSFTLAVTEGLELVKTSIKATLGGKSFFQSEEFTKKLTVTPPDKGKVSDVCVTVSVTDIYGRSAEKKATIPCAVHDEESRAYWESTMEGVTKTGVWPEDLVAIARSQIGYKESSRDFGPKYDGGISGYTRYGDWAGLPYEEWCAMFAGFCLHYAGVSEKDFPFAANCQRWINALKKVDLYASRRSYTPKVGDLAFFDWEGDNDSDHVGIIFELDVDEEENIVGIRTIEGNSKGAAVYDGKYYKIDDWTVIGYGLVNKAYDAQVEKLHRDLTAEFEGFTVQAGVEPEAKIPAHARLDVREIMPYDEGYNRMLSDLRGAISEGELAYARFLRFGFVDEDGTEVSAQAPLALTVSFEGNMLGDGSLTPGVAVMAEQVEINADVTLERDEQFSTFAFTQAVDDPLCLFATGELAYSAGELKAKDGKMSAGVSFGEDAMVPDGSVLEFREIEPEAERYAACAAAMGDAMPADGGVVRFFDILVTYNGVPVRPAVPVRVTLDVNQKGSSAELTRINDGAELVCQTAPKKGGKLVIDFNADRFATFAVVFEK